MAVQAKTNQSIVRESLRFLAIFVAAVALALTVIFLLSSIFGVKLAVAAEGHEVAHHESPWASLGSKWVHFLVYIGIMYWLLRKPLAAFWVNRRQTIYDAVNQGKVALSAANQRLSTARSKVSVVDAEATRIQNDLAKETKQESARIIEDAKARAAYILDRAKITAAAEERAAEVAVRRDVADRVIEKARERLSKELTEEADRGLRGAAFKGLKALVSEVRR